MSYQANGFELAAVSKLPAAERYSYFVRKVADWEEIWTIRDDAGWRLYSTDADQELVPVWPAEAFTRACCIAEWQDCRPESISLENWLKKWVPGMIRDGRALALFPVPRDIGMKVDPDRLALDIQEIRENFIDFEDI